LEKYSKREFAKKIDKHQGYITDTASTVVLHHTLEKHGMKAVYYTSEKSRESAEEIPVQHAD